MRVKCKILVCKPGQSGDRPLDGSVAVGSKGDKVHMTVSTSKNKSGSLYTLTGNICKIFTKFTAEGKLTLRLAQPPVDLLISRAQPLELQMLEKVIQAVSAGRDLPKLAKLQPTSSRHLKRPLTNLTVSNRSDYPFSEGFPLSLRFLSVIDCNLGRIDHRWFKLANLVRLSLPGNALGEKNMADFDFTLLTRLEDLNLANNNISALPDSFWAGLTKKLTVLNLSKNQLRELPTRIARFANLTSFEVAENRLEALPSDIGRCLSLRKLDAGGNRIKAFPGSLRNLKLDIIDLSGNDASSTRPPDLTAVAPFTSYVDSLFHLAAKCVLDRRIPTGDLPDRVRNYLEERFEVCDVCRKICLPNSEKIFCYFDLKRIASSVVSVNIPGGHLRDFRSVVLKSNCCSSACSVHLIRARKNSV